MLLRLLGLRWGRLHCFARQAFRSEESRHALQNVIDEFIHAASEDTTCFGKMHEGSNGRNEHVCIKKEKLVHIICTDFFLKPARITYGPACKKIHIPPAPFASTVDYTAPQNAD